MPQSKQRSAEEQKTISITETKKLRLKVVRPDKNTIEIINTADRGRICTLKIADFRSTEDALAYAELLRLAPELLDDYLADAKTLSEVLQRLKKKVTKVKKPQ